MSLTIELAIIQVVTAVQIVPEREVVAADSLKFSPAVLAWLLPAALPGVGGALLLIHQAALGNSVTLGLRDCDTALLVTTMYNDHHDWC